ncbi:alpha/beta fold hydrolase [Bradyrhizobium betae]|uniref:Alpha/beta hydrolase n=1 Tax=Bradyrhizobium betae TaxID=244734 RepID=A0A5P6P664_9BRAD|nr:alpha/beta hydrolase [Bradyrhizobium betae]MCS3729426.1 pimeloyl-ACP methyl ester carboxylesterase [Bradyrhizobium betae]QFI73799.1 alpha/beta hydrolase [Bradyrhizobium betae]
MSNRILLHGVPNTPAIWRPLIDRLGEPVTAPCLPGFCGPAPHGFDCTKDAYAQWLIRLLESRYESDGPVDLVGHDWGALLALRAASLRPDLIRSWAICGAAIDPVYRGHVVARLWNTPGLGELVMAISSTTAMERSFRRGGLPAELARQEASAWSPQMRRAILALYRSADGLRFEGDWIDRLRDLPDRGLVVWGANDPYVSVAVAERFAQRHACKLRIEADAGHWQIVERAPAIAEVLVAHWRS